MICLLRDYWENEMECFFVFVEGPDDERFITSVLGNDKIYTLAGRILTVYDFDATPYKKKK